MHNLSKLIYDDMKPAFGVTEPGAIAFAVATARNHTDGHVKAVKVALNSGMYKNAFTCGIPNSSRFGNLYAAALGAVAARADLGLESLTYITPEDDDAAAAMVDSGIVDVWMDHISSDITIDATVETEADSCTVSIRGSHTNIVSITKNNEQVFVKEDSACALSDASNSGVSEATEQDVPYIHKVSLKEIIDYVNSVPADEISFIRDAFEMNLALLDEGLSSDRAVIAHQFFELNNNTRISDNPLSTAQLLCNGAIEARVLGLSRPAMSITGSGAHGIIATMPLYAYFHSAMNEDTDEKLLRATALSYLICMYIKEYSGKLSAFCGCGIAAGTGMACGLTLLMGGGYDEISQTILNMSAGITGMICDGGNHGCAMKGIVATDAAFRASELAMKKVGIPGIHGINGLTAEDTMRNMGLIASPGMVQTEGVIVDIMSSK